MEFVLGGAGGSATTMLSLDISMAGGAEGVMLDGYSWVLGGNGGGVMTRDGAGESDRSA